MKRHSDSAGFGSRHMRESTVSKDTYHNDDQAHKSQDQLTATAHRLKKGKENKADSSDISNKQRSQEDV